ncbi:MAG: hypothetical protein DRJ07_12610 [Bacteroidetes bacterium]|nr:MAG: hypothetical protein DRJ07_12610 [Bacteroidota bacterium]
MAIDNIITTIPKAIPTIAIVTTAFDILFFVSFAEKSRLAIKSSVFKGAEGYLNLCWLNNY